MVAGAVLGGLLVVMLLIWLLSDSEAEAAVTNGTAQPANAAPVTAVVGSALEAANPSGAGRSDSEPRQVVVGADATTDLSGLVTQRLDAGDGSLLFEFTDECWLEVRAADGQVLYSDLGKPSRALKFTGSGPFSVLLGYAPAAKLEFNGEAVALAPHTRNNVATLVLGQ